MTRFTIAVFLHLVGMVGRELRSDENLNTIPVILVSARAGEESRIEGLDAGADDYLVKPFSARELLARVGSHIAMARMRHQAAELERRLRAEAEHRAAIVDSSGDAIVSQSLDGIITSWNKAAEAHFRLLRPRSDWPTNRHNYSAGPPRRGERCSCAPSAGGARR